MRVTSQRRSDTIPYAIPFSSFSLRMDEDGENIPFEFTLSNDLLPSQPSQNGGDTFDHEVWDHILPGLERVCVILRFQEYTHAEIAWIIGMKTDEVSRIIYKVRNRVDKIKTMNKKISSHK